MISLTNLTFGNSNIKSYLCTLPGFLTATVELLECRNENVHKAASHLLRNLAWKADKLSKVIYPFHQVDWTGGFSVKTTIAIPPKLDKWIGLEINEC